MVNKHFTDDEIQLLAIDKIVTDAAADTHLNTCDLCKKKVEVYQAMITGVKQQQQPAFDFDLASFVLKKLHVPAPEAANDRVATWVLIFVSIGAFTSAIYFLRSYLANVFQSVATILIYLIAISAITVIVAIFFDTYNRFRKKMKVLDAY